MPSYDVKVGNNVYRVDAPDESTAWRWASYTHQQEAAAKPAPRTGFGAALATGFENLIGSTTTAVQATFGDENKAAELALERAANSPYASQVSWDKVKELYGSRGAVAAVGEILRQVPLAITEQLPQLAATLGAAKAGAMAGTAAAPLLGPAAPAGPVIGGTVGALASLFPSLYGANIERQAAEQRARGEAVDVELGPAAGAAAVQTGLEAAATFIPLGRRVARSVFGPQVDALLGQGKKEAAEALAKENLATVLAKGAAVGAATNVPTEVLQAVAERAQAGLPLLDDDALKEYGENAYGGALVGGPLGAAGRAFDRAGARTEARAAEETAAAEQRRAAAQAEKEQRESPEYLLDLDKRYGDAVARMRELQEAVKQRPGKDADPAERAEHQQKIAELKAFTEDTMRPVTAEYVKRKAELARLKERQRVEGMTPLEYQMEQAGVDLTEPPKEDRVFTGEDALPAAPAPEAQYAQQQMDIANEQSLINEFEQKDQAAGYVPYLMQDPEMARRLVAAQTPIPGVKKSVSNSILGWLKLQLKAYDEQQAAPTQEELQQRQADLKAQQLPAETDPLAMWKASVEETEDQATEELLRPNFETLRPSGPATVAVAPGITPIQNPGVLLRRLDELTAARDQAAKDTDAAFAAGNKELGIKKSQEREAAQTALNNLEQTDGTPRALVALRKAQDTALMNAAQLADDLRAGRTLGKQPEPTSIRRQDYRTEEEYVAAVEEAKKEERALASSTPQTLINQINKQRDAFITSAVQEAAATRRLFAKALTQEEAETAAKQMRDVFNEWVTRSMAQPRAAVLEERVTQPAQMRGTQVVRGAETELVDPRPLEERRFGAYRAATAVLQEQLQEIAAKLKEVPRAPRRVEPTLKMQFPETEAAKVAEASGETAKTLEGALRRRRDYVSGLIDQALQTRKVPGIAKMLLTRAQDFISNATNNFLDAAENIASRILRGQNIERSDLVELRNEIRAAAMRPGEAEVAGEREGQRELFPAEERRALAPKAERGALGTIREKPAAFEAVRAKAAAKQQRADAAAARGEKLTQDIKRELDRIDTERQQALEARVEERRDSLQSAWQSAVKKARNSIIAARRVIQKDKLKGLKTEIDAIRAGGIEGLNKETLDRLSALRQQADDLVTQFDAVVEAAEFLPLAQANKWVAFERGALDQAQKALEASRTPQTVSALAQQQTALRRAETARLQNLKGEEKAAEAARMRAAQQGLGLPGIRREAGKVTPIEPEQTAEQKRAEAEERRQQARQETAAAKAARDEERGELEQKVTDLTAQVESAEAAQKRARTPASKERIQTSIDALNKDLTLAKGQLEALSETKPRKKGPATVISGAGLAKQRPLRTGYRKALEAAEEGMRKEREGETRVTGTLEREERLGFFPVGNKDIFFSRGATATPSTTDSVRTELRKAFPDLGRVQIYDSVDALVKANPQYEGRIPADARGFVDTAGNKAFLIAENIDQGRALGVLLHEVGAHIGLKNMLGDAQYNGLVKAVETWAKKTDGSTEAKVAQAALARVEAAQTPASQRRDETLAYAIEEAVNAGVKPMETKSVLGQWLGRIAQLFRNALTRFGLPPKALDAQGLVDMAFGAAKMEMRGMRPEGATEGELLFSRKTSYTPGLADAGRVAEQLVGGQRSFLDQVKANLFGFRTQAVDKLAPLEKVAFASMDELKATQLMYNMRMYDQRNHFVSEALATGVPERKEITRADGQKEFVIEAKPGMNIKQMVERLSTDAVVKEAGSPDAANQLFTLYTAAKRAERVGFQKLGFGRAAAEAELAQLNKELSSETLDPADRKRVMQRKDYLEKNAAKMPSEADIKAAVKQIEANKVLREAFEDVREMYNEYNRNLLEFAVQTGAIPDALAKSLLAAKDYIPYYRVRGGNAELVIGGEQPMRIGNIKDSPQLEELVGGEEPIFDFLTSSVQNTSMLLDMSLRNMAVKNAMWELRDVGLAKLYPVRNEKGGRRSVPENAVRFRNKGEDWFAIVDTDAAGMPSDLLVKGLAGMPTMLPAGVKMLAIPARILRRAIVANPVYMARQLFRDSVAATLASGANITPVLSSLKQIGKKNALDRRGITGGQVFTGMPEDMSRMLREMQTGRPGWAKAWSALERAGMEADAATRRAQYESYREQGLSEMEASYLALESMNFSKRGLSPTVHLANMLIPFFNAQIQGLDVLYRSMRGQMPFNKRLDIRNKLLTRGALLFVSSLAYAAAMQDEEEYKNARPDEKYGNWFVRMPFLDEYAEEPVVVRVPIPFELGYIFKALPEAIVNTMASEEGGKEALKALKQIVINTIPGGSSMPQIGGVPVPVPLPAGVKPAIELAMGRSFFTGRDIESTQEQAREPEERFRDGTSEAAKAIGQTFGISPVQLEYAIRGYTGGMGMALMQSLNFLMPEGEGAQAASRRMADLPLVGTLFQPIDAGGIIDATYARMKEIQQVQNTYENMLETGRRADAERYAAEKADELSAASVAGQFRQVMGEITTFERNVRASPTLSPAEKREKLDLARQRKIEIAQRARALFDRRTLPASPA